MKCKITGCKNQALFQTIMFRIMFHGYCFECIDDIIHELIISDKI